MVAIISYTFCFLLVQKVAGICLADSRGCFSLEPFTVSRRWASFCMLLFILHIQWRRGGAIV